MRLSLNGGHMDARRSVTRPAHRHPAEVDLTERRDEAYARLYSAFSAAGGILVALGRKTLAYARRDPFLFICAALIAGGLVALAVMAAVYWL